MPDVDSLTFDSYSHMGALLDDPQNETETDCQEQVDVVSCSG